MAKIFYDHLVFREEIDLELDQYDLSILERQELVSLIDETIHHEILDLILSNLPTERHEEFLDSLHLQPGNKNLLVYLNEQTGKDMEKMIQKHSQDLKKEILKEIVKAKKKT